QQQRRLGVTRNAPGGPHVNERDLAGEVGGGESRHRCSVTGEAFYRRKVDGRRRTANERGRQLRWVTGAEADEKQRREADEGDERYQYDQSSLIHSLTRLASETARVEFGEHALLLAVIADHPGDQRDNHSDRRAVGRDDERGMCRKRHV